jgi:hypothetical protein
MNRIDELVSVEEFGRRLGGIKAGTVHNWLSQEKFGLTRVKVGSRTMLKASDVQKVVRER